MDEETEMSDSTEYQRRHDLMTAFLLINTHAPAMGGRYQEALVAAIANELARIRKELTTQRLPCSPFDKPAATGLQRITRS